MAFESQQKRRRFMEGVGRVVAGGAPAPMKGGRTRRDGSYKETPWGDLMQCKAELEASRSNSQNPNVLQEDTVTHDDLLLTLGAVGRAGPSSGRRAQSERLKYVNREVSRRLAANDPRPAHVTAGQNRPEEFGPGEATDLEQVYKSVCTQLEVKGYEYGAPKPAGMRVPKPFWRQVAQQFYGSQFTDADESERSRLQAKVHKYERRQQLGPARRKYHEVDAGMTPAESGTPSKERTRLLLFVAS